MKTTKEIFDNHLKGVASKNLDQSMEDFATDAIYINCEGTVARGKKEIRKIYEKYFDSQVTGTTSAVNNLIIERDIVFLEWSADSPTYQIKDGVDTFVIQNGFIQAQTAKYSTVPK